MKIVWLAHECNLSGANIALLEYVDALKEEFEFHIILPHKGNMEEALVSSNISYTVIHQYGWSGSVPLLNLLTWAKIFLRSTVALMQTIAFVRKINADVLFTNTLAPFVGSVSAKILRIPHIWWVHEFGEEDFGFTIGMGNKKMGFRWMQYSSNLIICNSEAVKTKFQLLMPLTNIIRLYQPVTWKGLSSGILQKKSARFLMFGQIIPSKGHLEVLEALVNAITMSDNNEALSLHIKGPCENSIYLDKIYQFIKLHKLGDVVKVETGYFNKEAVLPLYEVLIVASVAEAFGRVIVEANKAGLKVIVRNSGGAPELINETNGVLYNDVHDLAKILSGRIAMPVVANILNYDGKTEIKRLKKILVNI